MLVKHHFFEEVKELSHKILPERILSPKDTSDIAPLKNFESLVAAGHEKIDKVFSTDQARLYTFQAKKQTINLPLAYFHRQEFQNFFLIQVIWLRREML